jgi:hypothetical protein
VFGGVTFERRIFARDDSGGTETGEFLGPRVSIFPHQEDAEATPQRGQGSLGEGDGAVRGFAHLAVFGELGNNQYIGHGGSFK